MVDSLLLRMILSEISSRHDIDLFSAAFIFDEKYASERNAFVLGEGKRTVLSIILESMSDDKWKRVFPETFDLGNRETPEMGERDYVIDDLCNELDSDPRTDGITVVEGSLRRVKEKIVEITGYPFNSHLRRNSLKALRVLKLIYLIQRGRAASLIGFIDPVQPGKGSMEHRDDYPLLEKQGFEKKVWLLADMRSYLGLELKPDLAGKVETVLSGLYQRAEQQINSVYAELQEQYGHDVNAWSGEYKRKIAELQQGCRPDKPTEVACDLDELLFVYVHALPFMHFAAEFEQIVEKTIPDVKIISVEREIQKLQLPASISGGNGLSPSYLTIEEAEAVYRNWRGKRLRPIVAKATGYPVDIEQYELLTKRSVNLLSRYFAFKRGTIPDKFMPVSLRACVVAMCAVWLEMCNQTKYEPYWKGRQSQGTRILRFLEQPFEQQAFIAGQFYPEVIDQIWRQRFEWMEDAVQGLQEIGELKATHKVAVLKCLADIVACLDIGRIQCRLDERFPPIVLVKMKFGISL